jgi:hypothetical protein
MITKQLGRDLTSRASLQGLCAITMSRAIRVTAPRSPLRRSATGPLAGGNKNRTNATVTLRAPREAPNMSVVAAISAKRWRFKETAQRRRSHQSPPRLAIMMSTPLKTGSIDAKQRRQCAPRVALPLLHFAVYQGPAAVSNTSPPPPLSDMPEHNDRRSPDQEKHQLSLVEKAPTNFRT